MKTPLEKSGSPSRSENQRAETAVSADARLALIKKRVQSGYYDSDAVIEEIVEAMMESMGRRARM